MKIILHQKSVFDIEQADTLIVPVGGTDVDLVGGVGRELMTRMNASAMYEFYSPPASYPMSGDRHWSFLGYKNFNWLCVLGILADEPCDKATQADRLKRALAKTIKDCHYAEVGKQLAFMPPSGPNQLSVEDTVSVIQELCSDTSLQSPYGPERTFHLAAPQLEVFDAIKAFLG